MKQYGVNQYVNSAAAAADGVEGGIGTNGLSYDIALAPLFFVRSGEGSIYGYLRVSGINGYDWSSASDANDIFTIAHYLAFGESGVGPSNYYHRYNGRPLRCLVVGKV